MRDHPKTILIRDHSDERPPWLERTLMRDHPETILIREHPDGKSLWAETILIRDHPDERPPQDPFWLESTVKEHRVVKWKQLPRSKHFRASDAVTQSNKNTGLIMSWCLLVSDHPRLVDWILCDASLPLLLYIPRVWAVSSFIWWGWLVLQEQRLFTKYADKQLGCVCVYDYLVTVTIKLKICTCYIQGFFFLYL